MLMPAHPIAVFEALRELSLCPCSGQRHLKRTGHESGACVIGHRERLLFRQIKFSGRCVVAYITASRLAAQPFAHITFCCSRAFCQLCRSLWPARRQPFVQAQLVADAYQRSMKRRAKINKRLSQEFMQLIHIQRHCFLSFLTWLATNFGTKLRQATTIPVILRTKRRLLPQRWPGRAKLSVLSCSGGRSSCLQAWFEPARKSES